MATRHLVGLDIGSKFVKAVQLTETSGQFKVTEFGIAEISPQVSVTDVISELFGRKNFRTKRVVSAVSGRFGFDDVPGFVARTNPLMIFPST